MRKPPITQHSLTRRLEADRLPSGADDACARSGHAERSQPILGVVGVDGSNGDVFDAPPPEDMAAWWPKFVTNFNEGIAPELQFHFAVPCYGKNLYVLYFQTDRAPYVFNTGNDRLEVPFRRGTETRSAKRSDLLRILAPVSVRPDFELQDVDFYHASSGGPIGPIYHLEARLFNQNDFSGGCV